MNLGWFLGAFLGTFAGTLIWNVSSRYLKRRREELFLRYISVTYKDATRIEAISVSTRDKDAMANVERKLRDASRTL